MRFKILTLVWLLLLVPVWAQSSSNASQLAQQLAQSQELPTNVGLRFQILAQAFALLVKFPNRCSS